MFEEKTLYKICGVVAVCVLLFVAGTMFGGDSTDLYSNTDEALATTQQQQYKAEIEVDRVVDTNRGIGATLETVRGEVSASRDVAKAIAGSVDAIKRTVRECQNIAEENGRIFNECTGSTR